MKPNFAPRNVFRAGAFFFLLLSLPGVVMLGLQRERSMESGRRLELMVGLGEVQALAFREGRLPEAVLRELKTAGVTALVVNDPPSGDDAVPATGSGDLNLPGKLGVRTVVMAGSLEPDLAEELATAPVGRIPVLFFRDEVLSGWERAGALPAFDELHPPQGLSRLTTAGAGVLRVHQLPAKEAFRLGPEAAALRVVRAVRERGVRLVYLHLLVPGSGPETEGVSAAQAAVFNANLIQTIREGISRRGYVLGGAVPFLPLPRGDVWFWLITLGVAGGLGLTGGLVGRCWEKAGWWAGLMLPVITAGLWFTGRVFWARELLALTAAVSFPVLGILAAWDAVVRGEKAASGVKALGKGVALWLMAAGIAAAGGCLAAGSMTEDSILLQVESFRGVKAALLLPLLLVGVGLWERGVRPSWGGTRWWERLTVAVLAAGAVGFYLIRSGNNPWVPVSHWENAFRLDLEQWFTVRPRFKEFILGHPALVAGLTCLATGYGGTWLLVGLILLGTVGQVSIVNTFLHLHTPWAVSIFRTGVGMALGLVFGLLCGALLLWRKRRRGGEEHVAGRHQRLLRF